MRTEDFARVDAFHQRCSRGQLLRRWGRTHLPHRTLSQLLAHADCWLGLGAGDEPLALVCTGPVSRETGVFDLGLQVADAHQRRGIGTALARHAAQYAQDRGAHTLSTYTEASNQPMLRLLRRLGPVRETRHGAHLDVRLPLGTDGLAHRPS
ncbi:MULTISPECIES: GNAT family N-acetyltransferase [unclassified Streptomyces]|uniref:GNAT family N-acetyltransferase n=1 Tax=unclassified Streptomyces TaxID=2593676 RepID=UPI000823AF95|nr:MULTISPECIES: GNAT family N-acetyltransferase [unclassified Streptomyces]MYT96593.1 GNAT family N-acetyltransferase [Streptomyces sp. SID8350]SCK54086.1 Acetyltransferases [Streptomyces sp. AmelKG-D3]